jgi:hypothetical protein
MRLPCFTVTVKRQKGFTSMPKGFNIDMLASPGLMDKIIDWKMSGPFYRKMDEMNGYHTTEEQSKMQRQFTIELRVDYEDNEKNDAMRKACAAAGRHVFATASLLSDGIQPQISIYSDDYFAGHDEIKLMEDTIQQGLDATKDDAENATSEPEISSELMRAVHDGR